MKVTKGKDPQLEDEPVNPPILLDATRLAGLSRLRLQSDPELVRLVRDGNPPRTGLAPVPPQEVGR